MTALPMVTVSRTYSAPQWSQPKSGRMTLLQPQLLELLVGASMEPVEGPAGVT
jgi:hypothetical protein